MSAPRLRWARELVRIDRRKLDAFRLLRRASAPLFALLLVDIILLAALPHVAIVAMAVMVARVPAAAAAGSASHAADELGVAFALTIAALAATMIMQPIHAAIAAVVRSG